MTKYKRELKTSFSLSAQVGAFTRTVKRNLICFASSLVISLASVPLPYYLNNRERWICSDVLTANVYGLACGVLLCVVSILLSWFCVSRYISEKRYE
jgi:hypothetical protein